MLKSPFRSKYDLVTSSDEDVNVRFISDEPCLEFLAV